MSLLPAFSQLPCSSGSSITETPGHWVSLSIVQWESRSAGSVDPMAPGFRSINAWPLGQIPLHNGHRLKSPRPLGHRWPCRGPGWPGFPRRPGPRGALPLAPAWPGGQRQGGVGPQVRRRILTGEVSQTPGFKNQNENPMDNLDTQPQKIPKNFEIPISNSN